jgi:hypothetical protein
MRGALAKRAAAADTGTAVAIVLISVTTAVLIGVTVFAFARMRKAARATGAEGLVSRAETQRYLAENWPLVEKTARETGMSDDEIARVRAKVLGVQ